MRDYKSYRKYADGTKHIVYYFHSEFNTPCSIGFDTNELKKIVDTDLNLSVFVRHDKHHKS